MAHVVGGLSLDQGRLFRAHLLECTSCRARVGELRAIAHDLADVERDERRIRTAKRTEKKAHQDEDEPAVASTPRLSGWATLLTAAGLTVLMALSVWNFMLRGRLQQSEESMAQMRQSVTVLQDGQPWEIVRTSTPGIDGRVATLGAGMVIMIDGLAERDYGVYLLGPDNETNYHMEATATHSMIYEYVDVDDAVPSADRVLVTRGEDPLSPEPTGTIVFVARRSGTGGDVDVQPVVEPTP